MFFRDFLFFLYNNPAFKGKVHDVMTIHYEKIFGTYNYSVIVDNECVCEFYIPDDGINEYIGMDDPAVRVFSSALGVTPADVEFIGGSTKPFNVVQYDIFRKLKFEIQYDSEENIFQQSLIHDFDSTGMEYVLGISKTLQDTNLPIMMSIDPGKLSVFFELMKIEPLEYNNELTGIE